MNKNDVIVLIPAYKPDEKLLKLLNELLLENYRILVVNDGSGAEFDHIFASIRNCEVIAHPQNKGKGAALKTGIAYINENTDCKYIITADADGQHTPADIGKLANFLTDSNEKFVIGSRKFTGEVPFKSKFGNKITIGAYHLASGVKIGDTQTGLRGFSRDLFAELCALGGDRYEYEINVLLHVAKKKIKINEIEIETIYIDENASSHFNPIKDSMKIYSCIFKYSFSSSAFKFCFSSIVAFILDFVFAHLFLDLLPPVFTKEAYALGAILTLTNSQLLSATSTAIARVISSIVNFLMNHKFVFKSKEKTSVAALKYFALACIVLVINSALVVLYEYLSLSFTIAYILAQVSIFIVNFIIQKKFIFK